MRIKAYRDEKTLSEVADKVYSNLTPETRKLAEAELVKANPALAKIKDVKRGAVLVVPPVKGVKPRTHSGIDEPAAGLVEEISVALTEYDKLLAANFRVATADYENQTALLKDKALLASIKGDTELEALLKSAQTTHKQQKAEMTDMQSFLKETLPVISKDLEKLGNELS